MYEIEMAVIGSFILWLNDLYNHLAALEENDFIMPECREIFKVLKNIPPESDQTIILSSLSEKAKIIALQACETYVISLSSFNSYLIKLKEYSNSRKIKERLYPLVIGNDNLVTTDEILDIVSKNKNEVLLSYAEKSKNLLKGFAEREMRPIKAIKTGFSGLDRTIGGLRIPAVSIIGALPSTGKTSFALNIVKKQVEENIKTVFFSLEMSVDMIYERLLSILYGVDYEVFINRNYDNRTLKILKDYQSALANMDLYVFDDIYDVETQTLICNQLKPDLVVVDYVQKVTSKQKLESRRTEIEYISSKYKQLAKNADCHIILLSQLTRGSDSQPTMRNLKESGALEADGDYIMILNRPYVYNKRDNDPNQTILLIDKNKFGATGIKEMSFEGKYQKFYEIDNRYEEK